MMGSNNSFLRKLHHRIVVIKGDNFLKFLSMQIMPGGSFNAKVDPTRVVTLSILSPLVASSNQLS